MSFDPDNYLYEEPEERQYIVLPPGIYRFQINRIDDLTNSKNGNPMIPLELEFFGDKGESVIVRENLVFTEKAKFKIDQFIKSISNGTLQPGRRMSFSDINTRKWMLNQTGWAKLKIEVVNGKTKDYDANKVEAFVLEPTEKGAAPAGPSGPPEPPSGPYDDEIPF